MNKTTWDQCSRLEREWWTRWKTRVDLDLVRKELIARANRIRDLIDPFFPPDARKILQVGPAANGEIHFLSGERYAIDPLASYFKENFTDLIDPGVRFTEGMAENLPYPDSFFHIVLIMNVLDHCWDPARVLKEITRCLRQEGLLVLPVNLYNRPASILHTLFNFLDREHPHGLTHHFIKSQLTPSYQILQETFYPLDLPDHDKQKKTILSIMKIFHLVPVGYRGIFRKM